MSTPTTRRFRAWYILVLAAVLAGVTLLDRAIELGDRPAAFALVATGLLFAVGLGIVGVVRILRGP
jgi:hypothetical protein